MDELLRDTQSYSESWFQIVFVLKVIYLAAAHCELAIIATFAGWGADAARHPNLSVGTYARTLKVDELPPATEW